jgi:hypothetical protein
MHKLDRDVVVVSSGMFWSHTLYDDSQYRSLRETGSNIKKCRY